MPSTVSLTPARRLVLIIGVPIAIVLIGWGALTAVAFLGQASYSVSRTAGWDGGTITINLDSGDLTVTTSTDGLVHMTGRVTYSLVRPTLDVTDNASATSIMVSCHWVISGNCSADLTVAVPPAAVVVASSNSGDVSASGLTDASLQSDSGDISATGMSGTTHLQTDSGDITGTALLSSAVTASDDSGDISLAFFPDGPAKVTVQDSSGDVTVQLPGDGTAYNVSAHTDSGTTSIQVPTDPASSHIVSISVDSGDVHVEPNG